MARVHRELRGIPQAGLLLGRPGAPVSIIEYADLACSECAAAHLTVVPGLIARYVRSGQASLEFRSVAGGSRSRDLALGAYAASPQRRGWNFIQLAYLRSLASGGGRAGVPAESSARLAESLGLGLQSWRSGLRRPEWPSLIQAAAAVSAIARFESYPVFLVRGQGDERTEFVVVARPRSVDDLAPAIARARARG